MSKEVMLFTPGLDSFLAYDYLRFVRGKENIIRCYFNLHSRYSNAEMYTMSSDINIHDILNMSKEERDDAHIPNRNLLLCTLAQSIYDADVIYMNGCLDDRVSDNSTDFEIFTSHVLSVCAEKDVKVIRPLAHLEKCVALKYYLDRMKKDKYTLMFLRGCTFSCFNPIEHTEEDEFYVYSREHPCLKCSACFRYNCAFAYNDIFLPFNNMELAKSYLIKVDKDIHPNRYASVHKYVDWLIKNEQ